MVCREVPVPFLNTLRNQCETMAGIELICPGCLKAVKTVAGDRFCPQCGATLYSTYAGASPTERTQPETVQAPARPGEPTNEADPQTQVVSPDAPLPAHRRPEIPGYLILSELGHGAMGVVYKARQTSLGRIVALKMILAGAHARPEMIARFRAEATAIARLQHPNIVQVYEVGEIDGLHFLTLEYINGTTLDKSLAGSPQPCRPTAELIETLARAMGAAHQRGIVHRDLKPSNILLLQPAIEARPVHGALTAKELFGIPKITDFGLAKQIDDELSDAEQTRTGVIVGTPSYMAPEQARGEKDEIGPAADIYALGILLYEMLAGRPPFRAATTLETLRQVVSEETVPPSQLQRYIPRDLETICLKCLRKDPRNRYPTAVALADDLRRFINGEPIQARSRRPLERVWRWCRRYPVAASLLTSMVFCLLFGFWYLTRLSDNLVQSAALESAAQQSDILLEVNNSYSDVVKRAKAGHLDVTHEYHSNPEAIPIPATFTIELGQQISDRSASGVQIRLYSDFPFLSRRNGGPKDEFETDALLRLRGTRRHRSISSRSTKASRSCVTPRPG